MLEELLQGFPVVSICFWQKGVVGGGKCVENDLKYVLVFRGDRGGVAYW